MKDPHSILGVDKDATGEQIRAAYRRLARVHHPDRFATATPGIQRLAQRKMSDLNVAYGMIRRRRPDEPNEAAATAYSVRQRRENAIREERYRRWEAAEAAASDRWAAASAAAGHAASSPPPPKPPKRAPKEVFAGDGEQLDGPAMMLRRLERLRAQRGTTAETTA